MDEHINFKINDTDLPFNNSDVIEGNSSFLNSSLSTEQIYDPESYFGDYLRTYRSRYDAVHGYLSLIICSFGIAANILNITVLTRKNMVSSINAILTGLAVSDMLFIFSYLPFAYGNYIRGITEKERYSYEWAILTLFRVSLNLVTHTISTWLTVTLAVWRFIAITFPLNSSRWCSMTRAKRAITATYVTICTVLCIPLYITFTVSKFTDTDGEIYYYMSFTKISQQHDQLLQKTNFWLFSVISKLIPCVALTVLSLGLILVLHVADKRRQVLKNRSESDKSHDRTTKMLLIVLFLFLLTEFPAGLLALFSGILGSQFYFNVYANFIETMDALILINSAVNFIIYCSMSEKFRDTFSFLFIPKCIRQQKVVPIAKPPETCNDACRGESYKKRQIL